MKKTYTKLFVSLLLISCSSEPIVEPKNPSIPNLVYPENEEACLDALSINETQSDVRFYWKFTKNAENFEVHVRNLETNEDQTVYLDEYSPPDITLDKGKPYQWFVVANGEAGSTPSRSETWRFYLAGEATQNFSPFPSTLLLPPPSATINPNNDGQVILQWSTTDVDEDLRRYFLYVDNENATSQIAEIEYTPGNITYELNVESGEVYYWRVVAEDENQNRSDSGIQGFRVN